MTAQEIRQIGKKIKNWTKPDGSWYYDEFEIWKVGEKQYQIQNHCSHSFSATMTFYGKVTELEQKMEEPSHVGVVLGMIDGTVKIVEQWQGTPDEIAEKYDAFLSFADRNHRYDRFSYFNLKIMELQF